MINLNELAEKAYGNAIFRGKITGHHDWEEFMKDLSSEFAELAVSVNRGKKHISMEIADVILVCTSISVNYGIDVEEAIKEKIEYNEKRKD